MKVCDKLDCLHDICEKCAYNWNITKNFEANCPVCRTSLKGDFQHKYRALAYKKGDAAILKTFEFTGNKKDYELLKNINFKYLVPMDITEVSQIFEQIEVVNEELPYYFEFGPCLFMTDTDDKRKTYSIPGKEFIFIEPEF